MNPSSSETSGLRLPPPVTEAAPPSVPEQARPNAAETAPVRPEAMETARPNVAPVPPVAVPVLPVSQGQTTTDDAKKSTKGVVPGVIEDKDLIDKEWVSKAKAIIERTRDDPKKQSEELTIVRADYMQQHYNKTIKLSQ